MGGTLYFILRWRLYTHRLDGRARLNGVYARNWAAICIISRASNYATRRARQKRNAKEKDRRRASSTVSALHTYGGERAYVRATHKVTTIGIGPRSASSPLAGRKKKRRRPKLPSSKPEAWRPTHRSQIGRNTAGRGAS